MASKRQKKKQAKRQEQTLFTRAGYSKQEVKRMAPATRQQESQRLARNAKRREAYAREKKRVGSWARKEGINPKLLKKGLSLKDLQALPTKQKSDLKRRSQKMTELERLGIKYKLSDLRLGWEKLREKYGKEITPPGKIRLTGDTYLYIGAAEVQGGFSLMDLSDVDDGRLIDLINKRVAEADADPSGSEDLYCVYQVHYGSREECQAVANFYYKRGYNLTAGRQKLNPERYNKITISNSFSQREFYEMIFTCISQMKNEDVSYFMNDMEFFCDENDFPFMRNLK